MTGISHLVVGGLAGVVVAKNPVVGLLLGGLGGVVADLDADNSWLQVFLIKGCRAAWTDWWFAKGVKKDLFLEMVWLFLLIIEIGVRTILMAVVEIFKSFVKHRGITHTLMSGLLVSGIIMIFNLNYGGVLLVGYLSHLIMDGMTKSGVGLFGPFLKKTVYLLPEKYRIKTGGPDEFAVLLGVIVIFYLVMSLVK